jgi:type II secretory pathway pseudopilin PulG
VLVELLVVVSLLGLMVVMAQMNLFGAFQRSSFKAQVQDFISTLQLAAAGRRRAAASKCSSTSRSSYFAADHDLGFDGAGGRRRSRPGPVRRTTAGSPTSSSTMVTIPMMGSAVSAPDARAGSTAAKFVFL